MKERLEKMVAHLQTVTPGLSSVGGAGTPAELQKRTHIGAKPVV